MHDGCGPQQRSQACGGLWTAHRAYCAAERAWGWKGRACPENPGRLRGDESGGPCAAAWRLRCHQFRSGRVGDEPNDTVTMLIDRACKEYFSLGILLQYGVSA